MKTVYSTLFLILFHLITVTGMQAQTDRSQPAPGPAPKISLGKPKRFELKNGLKVLVVQNHKLPRVSYSLTFDNQPFAEGEKAGIDELTGSLLGNGTLKTPKEAYIEEIDFLGAHVDFHASGVSAFGLSKFKHRILELMAEGALQPLFTQEEFDKEKAKLIESLKANEKNVKIIAEHVQNALVFGKNHPFGEQITVNTVNQISLLDIQNHYQDFFVPENAYLVVVGDVQFDEVKKSIEKLFSHWIKKSAPKKPYTESVNVAQSEINFVNVPHAVQSELAFVNSTNLPMNSPDFFPTLLANQILGGGGEGRLFLNLREKHGWTYGAYSSIKASKYVSKFKAGASVRNTVTDSAIVEVFNELKRIRLEKVSDEDLKNAKAKYIGNFVMQIEKPQTIARHALNIETQNLPKDFYENYIKNLQAVTPEQILQVANKYFLADNIRVVVVGKSEEVLPNLKKLDLPIKQFDVYGNLVE